MHDILAVGFSNQNKLEDALDTYKISLNIRLKLHPLDQLTISKSYNDIALIYSALTNHTEAIQYIHKALYIQFSLLPTSNAHLAHTYNSYGVIFHRQNQFEQALEMYQKSLDIELKILPSNDQSLAALYLNLASLHDSPEDHNEQTESISLN